MKNELNIFLEVLSAERGLSQNTLQAYQRDLLDFLTFLKQDTFRSVTPSHIRSYLEHLHVRALETGTIARRLSALRHFYRFLYEQKSITENPT